MIKAVRYLRVSTSGQVGDKRYGYARQRAISSLSERKHGLEVVGEVIDQISGAESVRPGLASLPAVAQQHGASAISLSEVDRLSRDIPGGYAIISELLSTRLDIYASNLQGRVNFRDPQSVKELNDALREGHLERFKIRSRTYGGLLAKAAEGLTPRALNLFGYLNGEPLEREAVWLRRAFELGLTHGAIAEAEQLGREGALAPGVGGWTAYKVHDALTNPTYKGEAAFGRELHCPGCGELRPGNQYDARRGYGTCLRCGSKMTLNRVSVPVPPLVSPELYDAVQHARLGRGSFYGKRGGRLDTYPLTGRIACGVCGRAMNGTTSGLAYYRCTSGRRKGPQRCSHRTGYPAERLHATVTDALRELFGDEAKLTQALTLTTQDPHSAERARVEATRAELTERLTRLEDGYLSGAVSLERTLKDRKELEAKLAALPLLRAPPKRTVDVGALRAKVLSMLDESPLSEAIEAARARVVVKAEGTVLLHIH